MPKEQPKAAGKRVVEVDFTGVEAGSNFAKVPEGDYCFKITKVIKKVGESSGADYLLFNLKLTKGEAKGVNKTIGHTCSLKKNALWNLRNLLEACGKGVPSKSVKINLDNLVNLEGACTVVDDEYEGKAKSTVAGFFPVSEFADSGSKKEEPTDEEPAAEEEEEPAAEEDEEAEDLFS